MSEHTTYGRHILKSTADEKIKTLFQLNKINCPQDPIEQMSMVLQLIEKSTQQAFLKSQTAANHTKNNPELEK
jgi:hypothetical protein